MKLEKLQPRYLGLVITSSVIMGGIAVILPVSPTYAEDILQEQGTLQPVQEEYTFSGSAGQSVTITMTNDDFDTVLSLLGPDGQQIAINDDFARSLNSTIITTLPNDGEYKVVAGSFSGQGGQYNLTVRPATEYEQVYGRAMNFYIQGNYDDAIAAYNEAIEIDPNQPAAYMDRADARWGQFYSQPGINPEQPLEPSLELKQAIITDYERAAELYEQAGNAEMAQMVREQISVLQSQ
jgi:tetratricopeptide (TPR) repeat protein